MWKSLDPDSGYVHSVDGKLGAREEAVAARPTLHAYDAYTLELVMHPAKQFEKLTASESGKLAGGTWNILVDIPVA